MEISSPTDWGVNSVIFDNIKNDVLNKDLINESEAQTRFDVIDRLIRDVLGWRFGQILVEEYETEHGGYSDYLLRAGDIKIIIEAKRTGKTFPSPTKAKKLKLKGSVLGTGEISEAINQALKYAHSKVAQLTVATNGICWAILQTTDNTKGENPDVLLLFPFESDQDAEMLFNFLSEGNVTENGLSFLAESDDFISENKLLNIVRDSDVRVERNKIADHLAPALDNALYSEAILVNADFLRSCYVHTAARSKFDTTLEMHLVDTKPISILPARRIRTENQHGEIASVIEFGTSKAAPPVTLVIAPVGVGKSTYLKHFELVSGKDLIERKKVHWIYIDFESMGGITSNVRPFIYEKLREYLLNKTDYESIIKPAYEQEIESLKKGPLALLAKDDVEFNKRISEYIEKDFYAVEPYVDKLFKHISKNNICVLVLDNTDLREDDLIEKEVVAEGLAIAKRIFCNVIISIRDTTYVKHKNDSVFDAYELRKLWLDPPPFKEVLSRRLNFSGLILKNISAKVPLGPSMNLDIPDLSVFFNIVQRSLLDGPGGEFIESLSALNIRNGIRLVNNFLTSGHIHADKALQIYLSKDANYTFPFQEVFKGSVLGQWKFYRESRVELINLLDSRLGAKNLRLLRVCLLNHLRTAASSEETAQVPVQDCIDIFSKLGANSNQIISVLQGLQKSNLIRTNDASPVNISSLVYITKIGGYSLVKLMPRMVYIETCMFDTVIDEITTWRDLSSLTQDIEMTSDTYQRMQLRRERFLLFFEYLKRIEAENIQLLKPYHHPEHLVSIENSILKEYDRALNSIKRNHFKS